MSPHTRLLSYTVGRFRQTNPATDQLPTCVPVQCAAPNHIKPRVVQQGSDTRQNVDTPAAICCEAGSSVGCVHRHDAAQSSAMFRGYNHKETRHVCRGWLRTRCTTLQRPDFFWSRAGSLGSEADLRGAFLGREWRPPVAWRWTVRPVRTQVCHPHPAVVLRCKSGES